MLSYIATCNWYSLHIAKAVRMQWNFSIVDTIGTQLAVLYREVSLIQKWMCTQLLYVVGTADTVLIREVSLIWSVLYRRFPLFE